MSQAPTPPLSSAYRADIDGLRAIAILLVLRFHLYSLKGGFTGVDIFFVISGFLITGILLGDLAQQQFDLMRFYAKRIRRIFPALVLVLLSCLVFGYSQLFLEELQQLGKHVVAGAAYVSNFVLWQEAGYFARAAATKPLLHLWSLAIEEQFYLLWPALLWLASRWRRGLFAVMLVVTTASFVANVAFIGYAPDAVFYLPFTRMWELSAGGLLAYAVHQRRHLGGELFASSARRNLCSVAGFATATLGVVTLKSGAHFPGWGALLPVCGAVLMIAAGPQAWLNCHLLGSKPMVWVGKISYPLYLWHWPVFVFAKALFGETSTVKAVAFVLSFVLAWLTYVLLEKRCQKLSVAGIQARRIVMWGVAVSLALLVVGALTWRGGVPSRFGQVQAVSEIYDQSQFKGCIADGNIGGTYKADSFTPCDQAFAAFSNAQAPSVWVIGDSHAYSLYQGFLPLLARLGARYTHYAVTFCPPLALDSANPKCAQYNRDIQQRMAQQKPDVVVIFGYYTKWAPEVAQDEKMSYAQYLQRRTAEIRALGVKRVMVVGHVPTWQISLPYVLNNQFLRKGLAFPTRTYTGVVPESLQYDDTLKQVTWADGVTYVSLRNLLCTTAGCLTKVGEQLPQQLMVYDYGHMTAAGAEYVVQHGLGAVLEQALPQRP